jgi:hypothetical protein
MKDEYKIRHFILFCKHWYKTKLTHLEALKVIASYYSGMDVDRVQPRDAYCFLLSAMNEIDMDQKLGTSYRRMFEDFITWFHGSVTLSMSDDWHYSTEENRLGKLIGYISITHRDQINFDLGEPDPELQKRLDNHYASFAVESNDELYEKKMEIYRKIVKQQGMHRRSMLNSMPHSPSAFDLDLVIKASGVDFPYYLKKDAEEGLTS